MFSELNFDPKGLIPAIAQDYETGEVLMMAYMNKESIQKTLETGKVHYFSRSRNKLWLKGETSGHFQFVKAIFTDCDKDSILIKVEQVDVACHTGQRSCFFNKITENAKIEEQTDKEAFTCDNVYILKELYGIILDRKANPKEGSYTNYLFEKGIDKILKKVGEENAEVIIAAKNNDAGEIKYEIADLFYHLFVLMAEKGIKPNDIYEELKKRR